jgi:hypothetical protein
MSRAIFFIGGHGTKLELAVKAAEIESEKKWRIGSRPGGKRRNHRKYRFRQRGQRKNQNEYAPIAKNVSPHPRAI